MANQNEPVVRATFCEARRRVRLHARRDKPLAAGFAAYLTVADARLLQSDLGAAIEKAEA